MASFRETRVALLYAFSDDTIDEEEFVLMYDAQKSKNPEFSYGDYNRFSLDEMDEAECKAEFRCEKNDLSLLAEAHRREQTPLW